MILPRRMLSSRWLYIVAIATLCSCQQRPSKEDMLAGMDAEDLRALGSMNSTPLVVNGIDSPVFKPASEVELKDNDEVVGISQIGKPRAYPIAMMSGMLNRVVNDLIPVGDGDALIPVTITYCSMTDCVRVLTGETPVGMSHLDVGTLGLLDGALALRWKGRQFKQNDQIDGLTDCSSSALPGENGNLAS